MITACMPGTLTVPHATIVGAVSFARVLGCAVTAARLVPGACELEVVATSAAQERLAAAHGAGRGHFEPAALSDALRATGVAALALTGSVRGTLVKRRGGRSWARERGVAVHAVTRAKSLELEVEVAASMLAELARLEAQDELTFAPQRPEAIAVDLPDVQRGALQWSAGALRGGAITVGGYGLLVAAELVRMHRGGAVRAESNAA